MTNKAFSIKFMIGISMLIGIVLVTGFSSFGPADTVSAAAVGALTMRHAGGARDGHGGHGQGGPGQGGHGQGGHGQGKPDIIGPESADVQRQISELREATARFHKLETAILEGYAPFGDCFSDPSEGGMGYHYANAEAMEDPGVDPNHPELLLYEKQADGKLQFVGVEYLTFKAAWHDAGNRQLPRLFGERFHLNTTLLDEPFYLLHVWQWKHNPAGRFVDWNPRVVCR